MISSLEPSFVASIERTLHEVPYEVFRTSLYTSDDLYAGIVRGEYYDARVYQHYIEHGKTADSPFEQAARTLHDYSINTAMTRFLSQYPRERVVGVMGGHGLLRTEPMFRQIVSLSKTLTEHGYLMVTGGGPGAMEATHLGAWLAGRTEEEAEEAIYRLHLAPSFRDPNWVLSALDVMREFPQERIPYADRIRYRYESLGIPTWLYGHEPATPFATHIAKFFDNSIREDAVLTVPYGGIVYTPGSAGTLQEIFQDAVQNHYVSLGLSSPMIFLGKKFWTEEVPVYPMMDDMLRRGKYQNLLLTLTDDTEEIVAVLERFAKSMEEGR